MDSISQLSSEDARSAREAAFNSVLRYLAKHPTRKAKRIGDRLALEYEVKGVPFGNGTLQCKFDLITEDDGIIEFKISNNIMDSFKLRYDFQLLIQRYVFEYTFKTKPKTVGFETMACGRDQSIAYQSLVDTNDGLTLLKATVDAIERMVTSNGWYRSFPNKDGGCMGCPYKGKCYGK